MKRVIDFVIAGMALLICLPVMLVIAGLIRIQMGGPILFGQARPGLDERPFKILKFRTMLDAFDSEGRALPDGERLTSLGLFLRKTSLDELPELWNVLKGDMSLVGPRPLLMQYLGRYDKVQRRRHEVKPGITGWAQINGRNELSWEEKFRLDVWYVDHRSFLLDLEILWRTLSVVLYREGISQHEHATMTEFLGTPKSR